MFTTNIDKQLLENFYNTYHPIAIYQAGSSMVVDNPKDIDIIFIFNSFEEAKQNNFKRFRFDQNGHTCEAFMAALNKIEDTMINYAFMGGDYYKFLYGNPIDKNRFNLFTNLEFRAKALANIVSRYSQYKFCKWERKDSYLLKPYRFLLTCYFLDNNAYTITEEQKAIINKVHDERQMPQDLWDYCERVLYTAAFGCY